MASQVLPPKKDMMLALLERSSVFIHVDPRSDDVRVPAWFKKQPQLVLQVGLNMAVRIPDLAVEDDAISCTLSFSRSPFFCYLPWSSVFALFGEDGKGMLWPADVPREVAAQQAELARKEQARSRLRAADAPAPAAPKEAAKAAPAPSETGAPGTAGSATEEKAKATRKGRKRRAPPAPAKAPPAPDGGASLPEQQREPVAASGSGSKRKLPPYLRIVK